MSPVPEESRGILDTRNKAKSVVLTEEGLAQSERLFGEMFGKRQEANYQSFRPEPTSLKLPHNTLKKFIRGHDSRPTIFAQRQ